MNSDIEDADLIISTPEKWDYITRSTEYNTKNKPDL